MLALYSVVLPHPPISSSPQSPAPSAGHRSGAAGLQAAARAPAAHHSAAQWRGQGWLHHPLQRHLQAYVHRAAPRALTGPAGALRLPPSWRLQLSQRLRLRCALCQAGAMRLAVRPQLAQAAAAYCPWVWHPWLAPRCYLTALAAQAGHMPHLRRLAQRRMRRVCRQRQRGWLGSLLLAVASQPLVP